MSLLFCQVLVIIDVKPKDLGLPTEAYISVEEIHDVSESWIALNQIEQTLVLSRVKIIFIFVILLYLGWHSNIQDI